MICISLMTSCLIQVTMEGIARWIKGRRKKQEHIYVVTNICFYICLCHMASLINTNRLALYQI
jgi:hypothetical protein